MHQEPKFKKVFESVYFLQMSLLLKESLLVLLSCVLSMELRTKKALWSLYQEEETEAGEGSSLPPVTTSVSGGRRNGTLDQGYGAEVLGSSSVR